MLESAKHTLLKRAAMRGLTADGYSLFVEPTNPPVNRLCWSAYRPDVLGVIYSESETRLALAECETHPRANRVREKASKIQGTMGLQKRLDEEHSIRPILVIPWGTLGNIMYPGIRKLWEIWLVDQTGEANRIPRNT